MIRSFIRSLFRPAPRVLFEQPVYLEPLETDVLTVQDVARQMRERGYSLRQIASELSLSYYMARKYTLID
jgi:hypothetical protein